MFQDSVPAGSYNDPFLSSVCVCVCGMMTFEVLQAELRQCRAMLGRHPASLLPLVGGEGQRH